LRDSSAREAVEIRDKESPLLEAFARERLVKTLRSGKGLAGVVVIF
jgi:hypothetical protein